MRRKGIGNRVASLMLSALLLASEAGGTGMQLYAAEPSGDEATEAVSEDEADEASVSENEADESAASENECPEESVSEDEAGVDAWDYLSSADGSMNADLRAKADPSVHEEEDTGAINYTKTINASSLNTNGKLTLTENTRLVMDTNLTLAKISGEKYALCVEGSGKLSVRGESPAIYTKSLELYTDAYFNSSKGTKFTAVFDDTLAVYSGKLELYGGAGAWASGGIQIDSEVYGECADTAALISSKDIYISKTAKVHAVGGRDEDCDFRFGIGAGENLVIEKGSEVYADGTYGIYSQSGNIFLYGDVQAAGEDYGIYAMGDEGGGSVFIDMPIELNATATDGYGIWALNKIDIKSGVYAKGPDGALWSKKGSLDPAANNMTVVVPQGGRVRDDKKTIVTSAGKVATEVKLQRLLTGGVTYNSAIRYGAEISLGRTGELGKVDEDRLHYQWEISKDLNGWNKISGATRAAYMPQASQVGMYIRVCVTADGYLGTIYSDPKVISKRRREDMPQMPSCTCSSDYKTMTVTDAKAEQEYVLTDSYNVDGNSSVWKNAKSPAKDGSLSFSTNPGVLYYIHTRYKAGDTDEAGTKIIYRSVYTGSSKSPKYLELDKKSFSTKVGEVTELTVKPVPADVEGWNAYELYWFVNGMGVDIYQDKACTKKVPLSSTLVPYKTVYVKGTSQTRSVEVGVEKQVGYADLIHDSCFVTVADAKGNYVLDHLKFEKLILTPGEECDTEFTTSPDPATVGTLSFVIPASAPAFKITSEGGRKVKIKVPENAKTGNYSVSVKVNGKDTPSVSYIDITISEKKMISVNFNANGGSGYMAPVAIQPDTDYILPECIFNAPAEKVFAGWDKGQPGEIVHLSDNITLKAQWTDHQHSIRKMEANEPGCTTEGNIECYICIACGKYFSDAQGKNELAENKVVIPPAGHKLSQVKAVEAGCENDGQEAYYECSRCSRCFYDNKGNDPVYDKTALIIPAKGHDWSAWKTEKEAGDYEAGLKSRTCKRCAKVEYEEIPQLKAEEFLIKFADGSIKMNSEGTYEAEYTGDEIKPNVIVKHNGIALVESRDYTLKYTKNKKAGSLAKVTVSGKGRYSKSAKLEYKIVPKDVAALEVGNLIVKDGRKADPTLIHNGNMLKENKDYSLQQTGSDLTISGMGNYTGSVTVKLTEVEATDYNNRLINVKLNKTDKVYDGNDKYLTLEELVVTDKDGKELIPGTDYVVCYSNNIDAGMVRVTVTGAGKYVGKAKKSFKIKPAKDANITVKFDKPSYTYKKSGVKPELTVIAETGYTTTLLYEGRDYKLSYSSNKKAGEGKFAINFRGNFKGAKYSGSKSFTIEPARPSAGNVTVIAGDMPYKKAGRYKPKAWVIVNGSLLSKSDVKLEYAEEKLTEAKTGLKINISSAGGNYEFSGAEGIYNVVASEKTDVSKAKVSFMQGSNKIKKIQYSGSAIVFSSAKPDAPQISVKVGDKVISGAEVEKNFYIIYADNVEKGRATVILKAKETSDYIGACAGSFNIVSYPIHR